MSKKGQDREHRGTSGTNSTRPGFGLVMERFGRIRDMDRSFDIEYWQRHGDAAIYAAWEPVESHHHDQGKDPDELRLQRSLESLQRR